MGLTILNAAEIYAHYLQSLVSLKKRAILKIGTNYPFEQYVYCLIRNSRPTTTGLPLTLMWHQLASVFRVNPLWIFCSGESIKSSFVLISTYFDVGFLYYGLTSLKMKGKIVFVLNAWEWREALDILQQQAK